MDSLPIIERELRRLSRRPMTYRVRSGTGLMGALTALGALTVSVSVGSSPAGLGRNLFSTLTFLALGFSLLAGPVLTADCLSEEKRLGTLGMLFLTNLTGWDLVAGKLVAMMMPAIHCLLALLPILGLCFFLGGVTAGEFLRVALVLAGTLLFSLSLAMLASTFCRDGRKAMAASVLILIALAAGLPGIALLWYGGTLPARPVTLLASQGYALWLTPEANYVPAAKYFWRALVVNQALCWGCLIAASMSLPHAWQERPGSPAFTRWLAWWRDRAAHRRRERTRKEKLLEVNPILWLALRHRRGSLGIWLFLLTAFGFWLGGYYAMNKHWLGAGTVFLVVYCLHAVLKIWVAWEASRRFAEDRNSGALELLLCTPLREQSIWQGWLNHLKKRFLAPIIALLLIDFMLMDGGLSASGWWGGDGVWGVAFIASMGMFIADTYTLCWVGLWQGLTARTSTLASLNCVLYILVLPAAGSLGLMGIVGLASPGGPMASLGVIVAFWFTVGFIVDFAWCGQAMTRLSRDFRAASIYGISGHHRRTWRWWTAGEGIGHPDYQSVVFPVPREEAPP
jgi:ABC-type transport system involved in multi-copper enzyme maturation permease subunit